MGRLTWKKRDGTWRLKNMDIKEVPKGLYEAVCKLKVEDNKCMRG